MTRDYRRFLRQSRPAVKRSGVAFILIGLAFWWAIQALEPRPHILQVLESPDQRWGVRLEIQRYSSAPSYVVRFRKGRRWRTIFYSNSLTSNAQHRATAELRLTSSEQRVALVFNDVVLWQFDIPTERAVPVRTSLPAFAISPQAP